jgi:hypothetical protein
MRGNRGKFVLGGVAAVALLALASPNHHAGVTIHAHRIGDEAPQRVQAAIDLGLVGFSVLVTWSERLNR